MSNEPNPYRRERFYGTAKEATGAGKEVTHAEPVDGKAEHEGYLIERRLHNASTVWEITPKAGQIVPPSCQGTWTELRFVVAKIDYHNSKVGS
jgi:hypothetical protein